MGAFSPVVVNFQFVLSVGLTLVVGALVLGLIVPRSIAITIMTIKLLLVVLYFVYFADGSWFYGGDDSGFFERGLKLYETGRNPITIWTHGEAYHLKIANPSLSLIYFHNYLSLWLFGPYYHSPILLNLILSNITVLFLARILAEVYRERRISTFFVTFASLHWTTLVWHSFLNLKEPFVALLLSGLVYLILILRRKKVLASMALVFFVLLSQRIRFYLPVFVFGGILFAQIQPLVRAALRKPLLVGAATMLFLITVGVFAQSEVRLFIKLADLPGFPYEVIHFVLQPAPWKITEPAGYLQLPSILHWIMFVPALIGGYALWQKGFGGRVVVGTVVAGIAFYGLIDVIASTRHRMPLDMLVIVLHYAFLKEFVFPKTKVAN